MTPATPKWPRRVSWGIAATSILLGLLAPLSVLAGLSEVPLGATVGETLSTVLFLFVGPVYGVVGAVIVSSQPRNSIGWVMVFVSFGLSSGVLAEVLAPVSPATELSVLDALLLALGGLSWVFFIFPIFHLMLTFPTGRVLSRAWRPLVVLEWLAAGFVLLTGVFSEMVSALDQSWTAENPIGFIPEVFADEVIANLFQASLLALLAGGLVSIVLRFRRAASIERQQLKWLLFAVLFFGVVYGVSAVIARGEETLFVDILLPVSIVGIGLAVGVAVLRYRLYDIDRFISRTVTYTLVVALLAGVVALVATLVGTRFDDPLVVAATTLGVAAMFNPLRFRVQGLVERRFNRSRYDAERVMNHFATTLRDEVDDEAIVDGWRHVILETMHPKSVGVWVRHK